MPGIHYLGKPIPGEAAVCFTLTRDRKGLEEIGVGLDVAASRCGVRHTDHWHREFGGARKIGAGGRIDLRIVVPVDPHYRPLSLLIQGNVHGPTASGVVRDRRACYPRLAWTAHRVSAAK